MVLHFLTLFLPCFASLHAFIILVLHRGKSGKTVLFMFLTLVSALYFFVDPQYQMNKQSYTSLAYLNVLANFCALLFPPLIYCYIRLLKGKTIRSAGLYSIFIPAFFFLGAQITTYVTLGIPVVEEYLSLHGQFVESFNEGAALVLRTVDTTIFNMLLAVEVLFVLVDIIVTLMSYGLSFKIALEFFTKGGSVTPVNTICCLLLLLVVVISLRIGFGNAWMISHPEVSSAFSVLMAFVIFATSYVATYFSSTPISWDKLASLGGKEDPQSFLGRRINDDDPYAGQPDFVPSPIPAEKPAETSTYGALLDDFTQYFDGRKPYLNPDLTVEEVARALHTNRTYVSIFVNQYYNMPFREYVNKLRIEHAKEMIRQNPNVVLDAVATASGFYTASQLNRKFKEIEGVTPRIWQIDNVNNQNGV